MGGAIVPIIIAGGLLAAGSATGSVGGGLLSAAGSVGGGLLNMFASQSAAKQEQQAEQQALQFEEGVYNTTQKNLAPYLTTGASAEQSLAGLYGLAGANGQGNANGAAQGYLNFTQLPSYQFPLQQGLLSTNRSLAASGLTGSGAQAKAVDQYASGYASSGFGSYIATLQGLAGMGQSSAVSGGQLGNAAATNVGGYLNGYGAAGAAGTLGTASALSGGINNALGALGNQNFLNALFGAGSSSYSAAATGAPNGGVGAG
jgi:hypothetical protein